MRNPKPVMSSSKGFFGILHFEVTVCLKGNLSLSSPFIPVKRYDNHQGIGPFFGYIKLRSDGLSLYKDMGSLHDAGIDIQGGYDNHHRTFRYNVNDYEFLRKMVAAQDLDGYLNLINAKVDAEYIRSFSDYTYFDDFYDDFTPSDDTADPADDLDDYIPLEDEELNPFNVGDKIMLNGVDDKTLTELGFKKRKHYTILSIHDKDSELIQVDDKTAAPTLDGYVHHRFFKLVKAKEIV